MLSDAQIQTLKKSNHYATYSASNDCKTISLHLHVISDALRCTARESEKTNELLRAQLDVSNKINELLITQSTSQNSQEVLSDESILCETKYSTEELIKENKQLRVLIKSLVE